MFKKSRFVELDMKPLRLYLFHKYELEMNIDSFHPLKSTFYIKVASQFYDICKYFSISQRDRIYILI